MSAEANRPKLAAKVLTVSDGVAAGTRKDKGGHAVAEYLQAAGFEVVEHRVSSDGIDEVANTLTYLAYGFNGVIVTTGGTGFGPRDLTPEATKRILDRSAPGIAEAMRAVNPLGRLSRNIAGTRGRALILNTPGSPKGAVEMLDSIVDILAHVVELMAGEPSEHPTS
ncbi:MAG: MogA/MoaB family molybdenum cofactor biosynthesis protein [Actinomycetia bacterium]|nr:MogA/MoaB family molybdenum cofactor biosynthesis protein [Actinomycetes bacterium]